jgi:hypothetical protein
MRKRQRFGHDVGQLISRAKKPNLKFVGNDTLTNKVIINLDVLCMSMEHRIRSEECGAYIVTPQGGRKGDVKLDLVEKIFEPHNFRASKG